MKTRRYKAGYVVHQGVWKHSNNDLWTPMKWAENLFGDYIGSSADAYHLCNRLGIPFPLPIREGGVCQIGFNPEEEKWYGWSHRAIHGFGIGDKVTSKKHLCADTQFEGEGGLPVGFEAKTLEDAKLMAIAFAKAVG